MTASGPTVGVIGLGYGRAHIPGFQANGCRVVAVCQRDEAAARKIAGTYGVPDVFTRWEDLIERAHPEIVVIATPPHLHKAIALRAFESGAHVLCEKPVAMNAGEVRDMIAAAAKTRRIAMTGFNWRFTTGLQELNSLVKGGGLGRVFHVSGRWLGARWADETAAPTWRMDRAQAGFGAMGDMGVHMVDMIRFTFGEFARVIAHSGVAYPSRSAPGIARPADADDYCTVLAELVNGAEVSFTASRVAHGANEHTIEAYGSAGAASYRLVREGSSWHAGQLSIAKSGGAFQRVELRATPPTVDGDPMEQIGRATVAPLVARLLEGIKTGLTPSPSLEEGLRAQLVLDAVTEACARGSWVNIRLT